MACSPVPIQLSGQLGRMDHYCRALREAGGLPVPGYASAPDLTCAGLVPCGGGDLDPGLFGQENQSSSPPDSARDQAELALFHAFFQAGRPILGICRGMQVINVALGGTLIQDLPEESRPFHAGDAADRIHPIRAAGGLLLGRLYGAVFSVNSWHHQAVDRLGGGLLACAWSESGFPEALCHNSSPVLGVQFHPERMCGPLRRSDTVDGAPLFAHFLSLCRAPSGAE